jgi:hypothetical protein
MEKMKSDLGTIMKNEPENGSIDVKQYVIPLINGDEKIEVRLQSIAMNSKNGLENIEYYILVK